MTTAVLDPSALETASDDAAPADGTGPRHVPRPPVYVQRFDRSARVLHAVIMTTFLLLAATGLPILFSEAPWGRALAMVFGGFRGAGLVHRAAGATLLGAVAWHVSTILWRAFARGETGLFWGPTSMVPQPRDFVQFYQQFKWFAGRGPYPRYECFAYWEKFDYWAVLWGTLIMGAAGLILWFPEAAARILPGWTFNVALFVHGAEALLAIGFIFVVHFFNGHLRPNKFPMDIVIFTGTVAEDELRHERAGQYERMLQSGELATLVVRSPADAARRRAVVFGAAGLTLGLALIALILFAVAS
jgi:cytochrome b subunit of formate dehydrogenase